jgi:hypothetical protein
MIATIVPGKGRETESQNSPGIDRAISNVQRLFGRGRRSWFLRAHPDSAFQLGVVQMSFGCGLTFRGITRAIFKLLRKKAAQNGIPVYSQSGNAMKDGVTIQWKYDPDSELLEVGCIRAPFWIDAARVNRKLYEEIESAVDLRRAA